MSSCVLRCCVRPHVAAATRTARHVWLVHGCWDRPERVQAVHALRGRRGTVWRRLHSHSQPAMPEVSCRQGQRHRCKRLRPMHGVREGLHVSGRIRYVGGGQINLGLQCSSVAVRRGKTQLRSSLCWLDHWLRAQARRNARPAPPAGPGRSRLATAAQSQPTSNVRSVFLASSKGQMQKAPTHARRAQGASTRTPEACAATL